MSEDALAMVIEDDFDASVIFAKALEVLGFKTEVIASGDKALARLKEVVPEIILLDLHLPEVLGTSILRTIRAEERFKDTLVIIASADPRSADLVQDLADLVLIKPTTFSQVRDLASRLTASRRKKREEAALAEAAPAVVSSLVPVVEKPVEEKSEVKTEETPPAVEPKKEETPPAPEITLETDPKLN